MDFKDGIGNSLKIEKPPERIVSLVPSHTETLFQLGLGDRIVGITRYCELPTASVKGKTSVGGTKNPDLGKIDELEPDLIITDKEEILPEFNSRLSKKYPVFTTNVISIQGAIGSIRDFSAINSVTCDGKKLISTIERELELTKQWKQGRSTLTTLYLVWWAPHMTVGPGCYIGDLLMTHGLTLAFPDCGKKDNYFIVTTQEIEEEGPEIILLPDEPFAFKDVHKEIILKDWDIRPNKCSDASEKDTIVEVVDGKSFCWYGARMVEGIPYVRKVLEMLSSDKI